MLSRRVGMSLTALLFVCFLAFCGWPGPAVFAEQRLLSGSSLPRTRPVFPEPLDYPRPSPASRTRRHDSSTAASHRQHAYSAFSSSAAPSSQPLSSRSSSLRRLAPEGAGTTTVPVLWRVEHGLTLRLWRDSSHVSPRLLALRYRDAPGGQDARDLVPMSDEDAENEADGADDVRNCFYSGDVVGEPGSKAVVSLCHGMTGYIYSPSRGMFTIEPVSGGEDQRGAHVLRHHRAGQSQAGNSSQNSSEGRRARPAFPPYGRRRRRSSSPPNFMGREEGCQHKADGSDGGLTRIIPTTPLV
ncbi:hypothetical protein MRX96_014505 [Rhipicephalus microplus]